MTFFCHLCLYNAKYATYSKKIKEKSRKTRNNEGFINEKEE